MSQALFALGIGIGTRSKKGAWLEVYYPEPKFRPDPALVKVLSEKLGYKGGNVEIALTSGQVASLADVLPFAKDFADTERPVVACMVANDMPPQSVPEAYLKLHLLSHRLIKPHGTNLAGIFKLLPNVAWTSDGAIALEELPERQRNARLSGYVLSVFSVDKFPRMVDYVVPEGVRIADASRVRLGAYLGEGTTVMPAGFINYNAGTEGPNMIEGRVSAGVIIGAGSDLGGGCSTMGTLSGGGQQTISVGKNCLIGANAGLGIPLGDGCTIEAGLYLTASSKVRLVNEKKIVKASELAGASHLLFRRNSIDGAIECLPTKQAIALNADLHTHN